VVLAVNHRRKEDYKKKARKQNESHKQIDTGKRKNRSRWGSPMVGFAVGGAVMGFAMGAADPAGQLVSAVVRGERAPCGCGRERAP
jgi:hypothetical protein